MRVMKSAAAAAFLVAAMFMAVLSLAAAPSGAQQNAECVRTGDTLSWTDVAGRYQLRGSTNTGVQWIRTVSDNTTQITAADEAIATSDTFSIRYRIRGEVFDIGCNTGGPIDLGGDNFCTRSGDQLTWRAVATSENAYNIRRVTANGSAWVATVPAGAANGGEVTFNVSGDDEFFVRYRVSNGNSTDRIDETCTTGGDVPPPTPATCMVGQRGRVNNAVLVLSIDNAAPGAYTLLIDGVESGTNDTPFSVAGEEPDNYFRLDNPFGQSSYGVISPNGGSTLDCGTFGTPRLPATGCSVREDFDGLLRLTINPRSRVPFEVFENGQPTDIVDIEFPEFDFLSPAISYDIEASIASVITLQSEGGSLITCVDSDGSVCNQIGNEISVRGASIVPVRNGEAHIREVIQEGGSRWISTVSLSPDSFAFFSAIDRNQAHILRYRELDGTVVDIPCAIF